MIYGILFLTLVIVAFFSFRKMRKKPAQPFPDAWKSLLLENVQFYQKLSEEKRSLFRKRMMLFLSEVHIEGVSVDLVDLDKILITASAVIPVFGFSEWHYNNLSGVLLYPNHFNEELDFRDEAKGKVIAGLVGTGRYENQMILSRKALYHGFSNKTDKHNTAVHEFVHLVDKTDGITDGIPERLLEHQYITPWLQLMHQEMEAINSDKSDIRNYGGTSETEFFAVASEYFFERPALLKRKHPELFEMLAQCFQQKLKIR
ncbi:MAG: zinc-dependent peptidase [Flavobacteriaceae bacterium]|nr:zinc-dependent peptidase [Flavobacteriaceae bacterium]